MQAIVDIVSVERSSWQQLLRSSSVATWWQSPACYDWLLRCQSDITPLGAGIMRGDRLVGLVLGYITHSRYPIVQRFSARVIINGGPLLAPDITTDELIALLSSITAKTNAIYLESRNFRDYTPWREMFERVGWNYCSHYDVWATIDEHWRERMHESKVRKVKNVLPTCTIRALDYAPECETEFDAWYQLLSNLYRNKVHRPLLSRATLLLAWQSGMTLLLVYNQSPTSSLSEGQGVNLLGGVLLPHDTQWAYEYYICGTTVVTYAMMEWCERQGIRCLDMMGAGEPDVAYGVRDFKLHMGGTLHEFGRFLCVRSPFRYRLGKLALRLRKI